jgi:hypothetical protein
MMGIPCRIAASERATASVVTSTPSYVASWAFSRTDEERAFESFVDFVRTRWTPIPGLHINHYEPYEPAALKRLMGRYATREEEYQEAALAIYLTATSSPADAPRGMEFLYSLNRLNDATSRAKMRLNPRRLAANIRSEKSHAAADSAGECRYLEMAKRLTIRRFFL